MYGAGAVKFACVGCGACCRGRFVPLPQDEAFAWLARGGEVAILLEAFLLEPARSHEPRYAHDSGRAGIGRSGSADLNVIAIFAGVAQPQCPNLGANNLCAIYAERPLVCRIYPMEINPFIPLNPSAKDCPPESWGSADSEVLIATDRRVNPEFAALIEDSREADRRDAASKLPICQALGYSVAGWKGNGLTLYLPERQRLVEAYSAAAQRPVIASQWTVQVQGTALEDSLQRRGIRLNDTASEHAFVPAGQ
ncbi:YkgJ family cysteine cluster protein [Pseudomonas boanensis]|uniref:YkgJ family cysteine cluster protein n=1 Tax=Metapseudomonas boanensis TaxID=2822138 RepID=UPI0035D487C7